MEDGLRCYQEEVFRALEMAVERRLQLLPMLTLLPLALLVLPGLMALIVGPLMWELTNGF
jgi:hypothetical protein